MPLHLDKNNPTPTTREPIFSGSCGAVISSPTACCVDIPNLKRAINYDPKTKSCYDAKTGDYLGKGELVDNTLFIDHTIKE